MADDKNFTLRIITPERTFFQGSVSMCEFNTTEGEMGILKGHIPMTVILKPGVLKLTQDQEKRIAALHSGFAEILPDQLTILAEVVEWPEEIDEERAKAALSRAENRLREHSADTDIARAQIALERAIARIHVLR